MGKIAGWTAAALVAGGITAGGYIATTDSKPDTRPGPDVKIELTLIDADGKEQSGTCSGVYIGNGVVITAKHCTDPEGSKFIKSASIIFDGGGKPAVTIEDVKVLWSADKADIAAFKISGDISVVDVRSAELACRDPKIGEPIEVVGNPLGVDFVHTWGKVAGLIRNLEEGYNSVIPIDAMIASGNSGGPVYDALGKVLGIADAVFEPLQIAPGPDGILGPTGKVGHVNFMVSSQPACGEFGPK